MLSECQGPCHHLFCCGERHLHKGLQPYAVETEGGGAGRGRGRHGLLRSVAITAFKHLQNGPAPAVEHRALLPQCHRQCS